MPLQLWGAKNQLERHLEVSKFEELFGEVEE